MKILLYIIALILLSSFVYAVENNHSNNIVAWYLMNDTTYKLRDSSVNSKNLTEYGTPVFRYENSTLAYYDMGNNDYLSSTATRATSAFTYTIWFNATTPITSQHMLNHNKDATEQISFHLHESLPALRVVLEVDNVIKIITNISAVPYIDLLFHNVVATYDGTNFRVYVDGVWITSIGQVGISDVDKLYVGSNRELDAWWIGGVASLGIYNTTLTASQILALNTSRSYYNPFEAPDLPVDTCTAPGTGNWDVDCSDNCLWTTAQNVPANMSITGAGYLTLSNAFTFTSSNQYIFIPSGCTLEIQSGGSIE